MKTQAIANNLLKYFETSWWAIVKSESVAKLIDKAERYNMPELNKITNIRPEVYAHLTPIIFEV